MVCMVPACLWTYLHSTILIPIYSSSSFASSCWLLRISSVITFSLICRCVWQSNGTYEQILHYKKVAWEWLQLFLFLTVSDCPKDFLRTSRTLVIQFYNTQFCCIEGKSSKRRKVICSSFWSKNFLCRQQIKKKQNALLFIWNAFVAHSPENPLLCGPLLSGMLQSIFINKPTIAVTLQHMYSSNCDSILFLSRGNF